MVQWLENIQITILFPNKLANVLSLEQIKL